MRRINTQRRQGAHRTIAVLCMSLVTTVPACREAPSERADSAPDSQSARVDTASGASQPVRESVPCASLRLWGAGDRRLLNDVSTVSQLSDDSCSFGLIDSIAGYWRQGRDKASFAWLIRVADRADGALAEGLADRLGALFIDSPGGVADALAAASSPTAESLVVSGVQNLFQDRHETESRAVALKRLISGRSQQTQSPTAARILTRILAQAERVE